MANTNIDIYYRASQIVVIAMGNSGRYNDHPTDLRKRGKPITNADLDPLAYWCAVEAIVNLATKHPPKPTAEDTATIIRRASRKE